MGFILGHKRLKVDRLQHAQRYPSTTSPLPEQPQPVSEEALRRYLYRFFEWQALVLQDLHSFLVIEDRMMGAQCTAQGITVPLHFPGFSHEWVHPPQYHYLSLPQPGNDQVFREDFYRFVEWMAQTMQNRHWGLVHRDNQMGALCTNQGIDLLQFPGFSHQWVPPPQYYWPSQPRPGTDEVFQEDFYLFWDWYAQTLQNEHSANVCMYWQQRARNTALGMDPQDFPGPPGPWVPPPQWTRRRRQVMQPDEEEDAEDEEEYV